MRIYIAAPLFNEAERAFNEHIDISAFLIILCRRNLPGKSGLMHGTDM